MIYSGCHSYQTLTAEMKDTSSPSPLEDMPVDYKYFKGRSIFSAVVRSLSVFLLYRSTRNARYNKQNAY